MQNNKDTLKRFFSFQPYECEAVQDYLTIMAKKGWMIKEINGFLFSFEKSKPELLNFYVDITDNILNNSNNNWIYVCGKENLHVFYSHNNLPIPASNKNQLSIINKTFFLQNWFNLILLPIISIFMLILQNSSQNFIFTVSNYYGLFTALVWLFIIILALYSLTRYLSWKISNQKRIQKNQNITYKNLRQLLKRRRTIFSFSAFILLIASIFLIMTIITAPAKSKAQTVTVNNDKTKTDILLHSDEIPVLLENLDIVTSEYTDTYVTTNHTFLSSVSKYSEYYYNEDLEKLGIKYSIFKSNFNFITKKAATSYLNSYTQKSNISFSDLDASVWKANKAYI